MSNWPLTKRDPILGVNNPCLSCPPRSQIMPLNSPLAIGFGSVRVIKDGHVVWSGDDEHRWLRRYEKLALKDSDHDWRCEIYGPMYSCTYQRHNKGEWVLIEKGAGFA